MIANPESVLALDVGDKRIGVAAASLEARLPHPLTTLDATDQNLFAALQTVVETENAVTLVVGFPRGLQGQETAQTATIEAFTQRLRDHFSLPVHFQDEALTSQKAKDELEARGKPYQKDEVDALAATYILEDWLAEEQEQPS